MDRRTDGHKLQSCCVWLTRRVFAKCTSKMMSCHLLARCTSNMSWTVFVRFTSKLSYHVFGRCTSNVSCRRSRPRGLRCYRLQQHLVVSWCRCRQFWSEPLPSRPVSEMMRTKPSLTCASIDISHTNTVFYISLAQWNSFATWIWHSTPCLVNVLLKRWLNRIMHCVG